MSVPGTPSVVARIEVRPQEVTRHPADLLDLQNPLGRGHATSQPVGDASLRTEAEPTRQSALAADRLAGGEKCLFGHILLGHAPINAQCANSVNANCGNVLRHSSRVGRPPESAGSEFWQRLVQAWGDADLPTSQNGIAKAMGMRGNGTTGRWFRGDALPTLAQLVRLAKRGNVTVDWLLTGEPPRERPAQGTPLYALLVAWAGINDDGRKHVLESAMAQRATNPRAAFRQFPDSKSA